MRIAVTGTANTGKTTLINDFNTEWPNYTRNAYGYRELIKDQNLQHSSNTTKDTQWLILNNMVEELQKYSSTDYVIFDRSPLDNLAHSLWAFEKNIGNIDEEFISTCIPIVRESLRFLDIVFFLPITKASPIPIVDNGMRETDTVFIHEIDNILKSMSMQYAQALGKSVLFPADDCPGIIEIFGSQQERIYLIKQYLNERGDVYGAEFDTALQFNDSASELSTLLEQQITTHKTEKYQEEQTKLVKDFLAKKR